MTPIMIEMNNWMIEASSAVVLGFSGENESKELRIRCDDLKSDAVYYLDIESAERKNTALMMAADDTLSILLTSDMLGGAGRKRMQIREVAGEIVTKSNIFIGEVSSSVNAVDEFDEHMPSTYEQYESQMNELNRLIQEVENLEPGGGGSGRPGIDGKDGADGKSAYELAVENGFSGSETEWLLSLKGEKGDKGDKGEQGEPGADGTNGIDGVNGKDGKDGTNGTDGKSAYQLAVENGFNGSVSEWLASLKGEKGADGKDGVNGVDGKDGVNGIDGKDGLNGKSAYELAVDSGFSGTLAEWLNSLKGSDGLNGANGKDGKDGKDGAQGIQGIQGVKGEKGDSGVEQQIVIENAVTSYTIKPNILYVFPELSQLDISFDLTDLDANVVNDFHFQFVNGATPCELNLPETVNIGDLDIQPNTVCEVSIINGLLSFQNWSTE